MGAWGTGIFQEDFTCDLKSLYIELASLGFDDEELLRELESEYANLKGIDSSTFWIALAMLLTQDGRLVEPVKNRACKLIDSGLALAHWKDLVNAEDTSTKQRQKHLEKARAIISGPLPKRKIRRPSKELQERIGKEHVNFPWEKKSFYSYQMECGDCVVFFAVHVYPKLLPRVYFRVGNKLINRGKPQVDEAWLILMDYRRSSPPKKEDLARLQPVTQELGESEIREWPKTHSENLARWEKNATTTFEEFEGKRRVLHAELSDKDFRSLHRDYVVRQEEYFEYYKDPKRAFQLECGLTLSIDAGSPVPADRLVNLKVHGDFLHNHQVTSARWDTLDQIIESRLKDQKEATT